MLCKNSIDRPNALEVIEVIFLIFFIFDNQLLILIFDFYFIAFEKIPKMKKFPLLF